MSQEELILTNTINSNLDNNKDNRDTIDEFLRKTCFIYRYYFNPKNNILLLTDQNQDNSSNNISITSIKWDREVIDNKKYQVIILINNIDQLKTLGKGLKKNALLCIYTTATIEQVYKKLKLHLYFDSYRLDSRNGTVKFWGFRK